MCADKRQRADMKTPSNEAIVEEQKKINRLRLLVDLTIGVIMQSNLPLPEAQEMVEALKKTTVRLFPGREDAFELIYRPRFNRIIMEKYRLH
jgi:hypothetical protein